LIELMESTYCTIGMVWIGMEWNGIYAYR
jgi:hypothetical protein